MDLNELEQRLMALEAAKQEAAQQAMLGQVMDKYGAQFGNNKNVALAILNSLNDSGIDVSAASDAVQQIMDQLRMEVQQSFDRLNALANDLGMQLQKINTVDDAVMAATSQAAPMPVDVQVEQPPVATEQPVPVEQPPQPVPVEQPPVATVPSDRNVKRIKLPRNKPLFNRGMISAARG